MLSSRTLTISVYSFTKTIPHITPFGSHFLQNFIIGCNKNSTNYLDLAASSNTVFKSFPTAFSSTTPPCAFNITSLGIEFTRNLP